MTAPLRRRSGVALFAAITLMALIGLMIGGTVATARLAERSARLSHADAMLTARAELGLNTVLAEADARGIADLPLGRATSLVGVVPDAANEVTVTATRLPGELVWLVSEARLRTTDARRRINLVARWPMPGPPPAAALVARGSIRVGLGASVVIDTTGEADCRATSDVQVIVGPGSIVVGDGIDSNRVAVRHSATDSAFYDIALWPSSLVDSAPGVRRVAGDTTITEGTLDGILLVGGNLTILGLLTVRGLIIAHGVIDIAVGSIDLTGAMLSLATTPTTTGFAIDVGHGMIRHSPCEVTHAWRRSLSLRRVRHRGWAELF